MSKKSILICSLLLSVCVFGCELKSAPECNYNGKQTRCDDNTGLLEICTPDNKWRVVACGVEYNKTGERENIGCSEDHKKCADNANIPSCNMRDYYCLNGDDAYGGKIEFGIAVSCINSILMPAMCSDGGLCVEQDSKNMVNKIGSLNGKVCDAGASEDALLCNPDTDKPKCINFDYYVDSSRQKYGTNKTIGIQLNCMSNGERFVWTPSYCSGGNICDNTKGHEGECLDTVVECPTCTDGDTKCEFFEADEIKELKERFDPASGDSSEKPWLKQERIDDCEDGCYLSGVYTLGMWVYKYCAQCKSDGKTCDKSTMVTCENMDDNPFIPYCSYNDAAQTANLYLCVDSKTEPQPMPCLGEEGGGVCSEKTHYCAECKPGSTRCSIEMDNRSVLQRCSEDEYWVSNEVCALGCVTDESGVASCITEKSECNYNKEHPEQSQQKCENVEDNTDGTVKIVGKKYICGEDNKWKEMEGSHCGGNVCMNSLDCGVCNSNICKPGSDGANAKMTYCLDGNSFVVDCSSPNCKEGEGVADCEAWPTDAVACHNLSDQPGSIGYLTTVAEGVHTETRCEVTCGESDEKCPVSCKSETECGECVNGLVECEVLDEPEADPEDTDHPFIVKIKKCVNGTIEESKSKFSCKIDGSAGECINSPLECHNNEEDKKGVISGCLDGVSITENCEASCSGITCGDCIEGAVKACEIHNLTKVLAKQTCVNGKWHVDAFCNSCDDEACKVGEETCDPETDENCPKECDPETDENCPKDCDPETDEDCPKPCNPETDEDCPKPCNPETDENCPKDCDPETDENCPKDCDPEKDEGCESGSEGGEGGTP